MLDNDFSVMSVAVGSSSSHLYSTVRAAREYNRFQSIFKAAKPKSYE